MTTVAKGLSVVFSLNGAKLGGQLNAVLQRTAAAIDITNKINGEWTEVLGGVKNWKLVCNGAYLKNSDALKQLENAFMNNIPVDVSFAIDDTHYSGKGIIIDFPVNTDYNDMLKYSLTF